MVSTLPVSNTLEVGVWISDTSLVLGWLRLAPQPLCEWRQGHKVSSENLQGLEGSTEKPLYMSVDSFSGLPRKDMSAPCWLQAVQQALGVAGFETLNSGTRLTGFSGGS